MKRRTEEIPSHLRRPAAARCDRRSARCGSPGLIEALFCRLLLKVTAIRVAHLFLVSAFLAMAGLVIVAVNQKFGGGEKEA